MAAARPSTRRSPLAIAFLLLLSGAVLLHPGAARAAASIMPVAAHAPSLGGAGGAIVAPANGTARSANQAPVAVNDTLLVAGGTGSVNVLANDSDPDGDTLTVASVNGVPPGVIADVTGGNVRVIVLPGVTLPIGFGYTIADGNGGTASAQITVRSQPEPPDTTITAGPSGLTKETSATIEFTSTITPSSFECRVDGGAFASCSSRSSSPR